VPLLKTQLDDVFLNKPPEFIYAADFSKIDKNANAKYSFVLTKVLKDYYWQVTSMGVAQPLFIRIDKLPLITASQWQEWTKLSFDRIENKW
jgi:hypothetical protein